MNTLFQIKMQIDLVLEKIKGAYSKQSSKDYKTLVDVLDRLINLLDRDFDNKRELTENYCYLLFDKIKRQTVLIEHISREYIEKEDYLIYREWMLSFEKLTKIKEKLNNMMKYLKYSSSIKNTMAQNNKNEQSNGIWIIDCDMEYVSITKVDTVKAESNVWRKIPKTSETNQIQQLLDLLFEHKPKQIVFDKTGFGLVVYEKFIEAVKTTYINFSEDGNLEYLK